MTKLLLILTILLAGCLGPSKSARTKYVEQHTQLDQRMRRAILNGSIILGMNYDQVKASWGKPDDINTTVLRDGSVHRQLVYGIDYGRNYIYLEDDIVTGWQN